MRSPSEEQRNERDALLEEYRRLIDLANQALAATPMHGRPNWILFYAAQERIVSVVQRIREINDGAR